MTKQLHRFYRNKYCCGLVGVGTNAVTVPKARKCRPSPHLFARRVLITEIKLMEAVPWMTKFIAHQSVTTGNEITTMKSVTSKHPQKFTSLVPALPDRQLY
jgi:hypothetical protein